MTTYEIINMIQLACISGQLAVIAAMIGKLK